MLILQLDATIPNVMFLGLDFANGILYSYCLLKTFFIQYIVMLSHLHFYHFTSALHVLEQGGICSVCVLSLKFSLYNWLTAFLTVVEFQGEPDIRHNNVCCWDFWSGSRLIHC